MHTIGHAYSVMNQVAMAREAADRLLTVISKSGANADSATIRAAINDALAWKRAAETIPAALTS